MSQNCLSCLLQQEGACPTIEHVRTGFQFCADHHGAQGVLEDFAVPVRIETISDPSGKVEEVYNRLVSTNDVEPGTVVWRFNAEVARLARTIQVRREELDAWPEQKRQDFKSWCWQDDWDCFTGCSDRQFACIDRTNFLQHSCDPTCWFQGDGVLVARRQIKAGEQLSIEYATSDTTFTTFEEPCCCKSRSCRKMIRNADYLNPAIVLPFQGHMRQFLDTFWKKEVAGRESASSVPRKEEI